MIRSAHSILTRLAIVAVLILRWTPVFAQDDKAALSAPELFALGQQAFDDGRFQDAVDNFEALIDQNNNFAPAYHALGLVYQQISPDLRYPLWYFETAIEIDPNFAPSYDMLCRSYYQLEDFPEAEAMCLQAIEKNPDLLSSQLALAWVYLVGYSDANKAIYFFERVAERLKIPVVYFGMGMAYAMSGDHARVLEMVTDLRSQGSEEFARQLEGILRSQAVMEQMRPKGMSAASAPQPKEEAVAEQTPVAAQPVVKKVPVPVPVILTPKISGSPSVRIKGKIKPPQIKGLSGYSQSATRGGQSGTHPGSLSED